MIKRILDKLKKSKSDDKKGHIKDNSPKTKPSPPILTKNEAFASFIQATDGQPARNLGRI